MYTHSKQYITAGAGLDGAEQAIIMIHGRGADAEGIASLASHLPLQRVAVVAPQATKHSWYPYSFMAPASQNQPALDSALEIMGETVADLKAKGILEENIYFLGFSQGACLSLEYVARHAKKYAGVVALTGGLIGDQLDLQKYKGDFEQTPIFISTNDPDPHVPLHRVNESVEALRNLNAEVQLKVYPGRPHTITADELKLASDFVFIKR